MKEGGEIFGYLIGGVFFKKERRNMSERKEEEEAVNTSPCEKTRKGLKGVYSRKKEGR